ncbi:MAG: maltotransferase domain-containing protein, partial [Nocardioidaceae bacterium]
MVERIPVTGISPVVEQARYPVKAVVGESFTVQAVVFREGHDALGAAVVLTDPSRQPRPMALMAEGAEPDHYSAVVTPDAEGPWTYHVTSWS